MGAMTLSRGNVSLLKEGGKFKLQILKFLGKGVLAKVG